MASPGTTRRITFTLAGNPPVLVTAVENNGSIVFTLDVQESTRATADLRGFFLNLKPGRAGDVFVEGDRNLTEAVVGNRNVADLGDGVTLASRTRSKFDIGLEWGTLGRTRDDINGPVSFTLSNSRNDLTLDDIARQTFGAKLDSVGGVGTARGGSLSLVGRIPSPPLARNDKYAMEEDGSGGAANSIPVEGEKKAPGITLDVLANDRDGDRDVLTIDSVLTQPLHGTLTVAEDGRSLFYVPNEGWAGTEVLNYRVTDGNGGYDEARVTITVAARADAPVVSVTTAAGETAQEMLVTVSAALTDTDGSEQITGIAVGNLPNGVTVVANGQAVVAEDGTMTQEFRVTLPSDQSTDFDLDFVATSREGSNGPTASTTGTTSVASVQTSNVLAASFAAIDQNIWTSGDSFSFRDDRFIGVDEDVSFQLGDEIYAGVDAAFKLGFQSTLEITAGYIDATADYEVAVDTFWNLATDVFTIDTSATLLNAAFNAVGPGGSYTLDWITDIALRAFVGYDIGIDSGEYDLIDFDFDFTRNIIDLGEDDAELSIEFPEPFDSLSLDFAWPSISTEGAGDSSVVTGEGASNNFMQLNLDVVKLALQVAEFAGAVGASELADFINPDPFDFAGIVSVDATFLEVVLSAGLNFLQSFELDLGDLSGMISFEDGSSMDYTIGDSLTLTDASAIDLAGNGDGDIDFSFELSPEATLANETALGFNLGVLITLFEVAVEVDLLVDSYEATLGPAWEYDETFPIADITVFNDTFDFSFGKTELVLG